MYLPFEVIPLAAASEVVSKNLGEIPYLQCSYRLYDFLLAPPNTDIDKIGRPPTSGLDTCSSVGQMAAL